MFIIMAAVTTVTAALAKFVLELYLSVTLSPVLWGALIIAACLMLLVVGRYRVLERTMKWVMGVLLLCTLAAVVIAATGGPGRAAVPVEIPVWWGVANFGFVLAFMGWMPIPIDSAIWNSIWVREHGAAAGRAMTLREALFDYRLGYLTVAAVAVLFLALGALVMFGRGEDPTAGGAMHRLTEAARGRAPAEGKGRRGYLGWLLAQAAVGFGILAFFGGGLRAMVDLATTLSFLTAPVLAVINYLVITRLAPPEARPGRGLRWLSLGSIVFLVVFSAAYLAWLVAG